MVNDTAPLRGRRVVVTRAHEQSIELVNRLAESGAEVLMLPMVQFFEARDPAGMDRAIAELAQFDWVIFTSANAVRFFLRRCGSLGRLMTGGWPKIAVVGPATLEALEAEGLRAAMVPLQFNGASLLAELAGVLPGVNILLPRSDRANAELPASLRAAGASVTEVIAYRTASPEEPEPESMNMAEQSDGSAPFNADIVGALRRGDADAVTFFSPSAFHHFERTFGREAMRKMSQRMVFAAVGPVTASAIRDAGLPLAVEATEATTASLVAALERHFAPGGGKQG